MYLDLIYPQFHSLSSQPQIPPTPSHSHVLIHAVCWNIDWFCLITGLGWVTLTAWSSWVQWVISRRQYFKLPLHPPAPTFFLPPLQRCFLCLPGVDIMFDSGLSPLRPLTLTPDAIMSHCTNCWLLLKSSANVRA